MKVKVTITHDEIKEAIIDWMGKRGLPVVLVVGEESNLPPIEASTRYNNGQWNQCDQLRLTVEFEVDSYSSK